MKLEADQQHLLEYDENLKFASIIWRDQVTSAQRHIIDENLLLFVRKYKIRKIIASIHYSHVISSEDQDWLIEYLFPKMYAAGLRYSAFVIPQNQQTRSLIEEVVRRIDPNKIQVQFFSSWVRAKDWLIHL